jgi:hypothetical protein
MDRGQIVSCHVVECHEDGYPVDIGDLRPRGYRAGGIEPGSFCASSFFDREYRTILGLLAEPRKR